MSKMTDIKLNEISLVDHPAHMVEGFAVIKSANDSSNRALFSALRKENMTTETKSVEDVLKELSVDDILKAVSDEQREALAKAFPPKKAAPAADDEDEDDKPVAKAAVAPEVQALIEKAESDKAALIERLEKAEKAAEIEKAARLDEQAIAKSKTELDSLAVNHDVVAPALRKFAEQDADAAAAITELLKSVNTQARESGLFKELGTAAAGDADASASGQLDTIAKALSTEKGLPFAKAYEQAVAEHPELVNAYYKENK
jgi:hypothetical protein